MTDRVNDFVLKIGTVNGTGSASVTWTSGAAFCCSRSSGVRRARKRASTTRAAAARIMKGNVFEDRIGSLRRLPMSARWMDPQKTDRGAPTRAIGLAKCVVDADQASASPTIDELILGVRSPERLEFI